MVVVLELLVVVGSRSNVVVVDEMLEVVVVSVDDVVLRFVVVVASSPEPAAPTSDVEGDSLMTGPGLSSPSEAVADQMNPPRNATTPAITAAIAVLRPFMSPVCR